MNDVFDKKHNLSRGPSDISNSSIELTDQQAEIHRNLESIGPEIAAYYLDGIRILQDKNLETAASLLAHVAREIDGGLRNILSIGKKEELKFVIRIPDNETLVCEKGKEGTLKFTVNAPGKVKVSYNRIGKHKDSILQSLGIDDPSSLAERWIKVTKRFAEFAHRHGAWKSPRRREDFEPLWSEFEDVLANLVGNYLNLLSKVVGRILEYEKPTEEMRGVLPYLLQSEARRKYFFSKLEFVEWLEPLKDDGWFDPDRNPMPQESSEQPGYYYSSRWHELEYVVKISTHPERSVDILVDIVNAITDESREWTDNGRTDLDIVKIIGTLPIEKIEPQHIAFMGASLKSSQKYGLMDQEIGQIILPKLLNGGKRELTLMLLSTILEAKLVDREIRSVMDDYWLEDALKKYGHAIANLCSIDAAQIALTQIRTLAAEDSSVFHFIHPVENDLSRLSRADYTELIVRFTSSILKSAEPASIKETIQGLLQESHIIIKRVAVRTITDHYSDLKPLFWGWEGNPLDEIELEPEVSQLIQANSHTFNEDEMEQILQWIESTQY